MTGLQKARRIAANNRGTAAIRHEKRRARRATRRRAVAALARLNDGDVDAWVRVQERLEPWNVS